MSMFTKHLGALAAGVAMTAVVAGAAGIGAAIGALVCWLINRGQIKTEYERARRESETERATILERLSGKEAQIE